VGRTPGRQPHAVAIPPPLDLSVFRQMADMSSDAFYLTDARGRFLYVNDRAMTVGGYTPAEMLRMTVPDINPEFPPARFREFTANLGDAPLPPFETLIRRKDGTVIPVEISISPVTTDGEVYMFGIVRDISERKQVESARKTFATSLLQTLEAERQRVARELHDEVGQAIATVGVLLHTLEQTPGSINENTRPALAATQSTVRQITESVARIVRDYHPAELLALGFEETVRTHVVQFTQRHGLALQLATIPINGILTPENELHLYRIVQEALANVVRHASARRVTVRMSYRGGRATLVIRDDGVGFRQRAPGAAGLGLVTMRERADILGADLAISSKPGRGTEIRVTLPVGVHTEGTRTRRQPTGGKARATTPPTPEAAALPSRRGNRTRRRRRLSAV